jgi:peptide/nickel transport system substrate-binding protein
VKRANLLIGILIIVSILLGACTPAATPTAVPATAVPPTAVPTKAAAPATAAPAAPTAVPAVPTKAPAAPTAPAETPRKGGTLNVGLPVDPGTMDPRLMNDTSAANINELVYNGLVFNDENVKAQPDLAERWENPTPTTWIFYLKKGVKFHNGTELTAADVKYTFETIVDVNFKSPRRSLYATITSVDVVDTYTVKFNLSSSYAPLLAYLDMGIVSKAVAEKADNKLAEAPMGTGPFKFVSWSKGNKITLERNDAYFRGAPYLDKVVLNIIPDNSVRAVGLESGDLDLIQTPMAGQDVKRLKTNPKLKLTQTTGLGITYININCSDPLFSDVKVRQAIGYLVDRQTIVDTIYEGMDIVGISSAVPGTWWGAPTVKGLSYDPTKAKALLAEAGWKLGSDGILAKDGKQFKFKLTTYNDPNRMQLIQYLSNEWKKVGIVADLGVAEWAPFIAEVQASKHQMSVIGWLSLVDPDRAFYRQFAKEGDSNWGKYDNAKVNDLLIQARQLGDQAKRADLYSQAAQIIVDEAPYVYVTYQGYVCVYNTRVRGYIVNPSQSLKYIQQAWLAQ